MLTDLPPDGIAITYSLTVADVDRSAEFYSRIFDGTIIRAGRPSIVQIANSWVILNAGGGPTDDKPSIWLRPPRDRNAVSGFMNIRVGDIASRYAAWRARGAEFLTEPKDHGAELRCYIRDPDGYLIEVGQLKPG
jgi:catechol 2,3-dioxygenase-like lactoylglutathione lyase family enzyme